MAVLGDDEIFFFQVADEVALLVADGSEHRHHFRVAGDGWPLRHRYLLRWFGSLRRRSSLLRGWRLSGRSRVLATDRVHEKKQHREGTAGDLAQGAVRGKRAGSPVGVVWHRCAVSSPRRRGKFHGVS
jgi:hypothetical protein